MLSAKLLAMLRCPENRSTLSIADAALIGRLNSAIAAGRLKTRGGENVEKPIDAALIRADGKLAYPIIDQIPVLLIDEGIWLEESGT
jgi:uncharacterized protein